MQEDTYWLGNILVNKIILLVTKSIILEGQLSVLELMIRVVY